MNNDNAMREYIDYLERRDRRERKRKTLRNAMLLWVAIMGTACWLGWKALGL